MTSVDVVGERVVCGGESGQEPGGWAEGSESPHPAPRRAYPGKTESLGRRASVQQRTAMALEAVVLAPELRLLERLWPEGVVPTVAQCPLGEPVLVIEGERVSLLRDDGALACPFVRCKHHNYLDVNERNGSLRIRFPEMDPTEIPDPCSLHAAMRHEGLTLEEVGARLSLTRERIRQEEAQGLLHLAEEVEDTFYDGDDDVPPLLAAARALAAQRAERRAERAARRRNLPADPSPRLPPRRRTTVTAPGASTP